MDHHEDGTPLLDGPFFRDMIFEPAGREFLRQRLLECLGGPWPEGGDPRPQLEEVIQKDGYRIERVSFEATGEDRIPALVLVPEGVSPASPAPAIAVWHQHNGEWHLGKSEPAGLAGNPMHHTGVALVKEGYVVVCPDALCFEERQDGKLRGGDYERFEFLRHVVSGKCLAWRNILDMRRTIDYICTRPDVDPRQIGCYGHSMGSTFTWLVGPWEDRLRCLVGNCCLPTYRGIHKHKLLHCFPNFIPGWYRYADTPEIVALCCPKPLHMNFGAQDEGSPIEEVREAVARIAKVYQLAGVPENFSFFIEEDAGHVLSPAMWTHVQKFFAKHLRQKPTG